MRLIGNCNKCSLNVTFETDMKDDKIVKCFRCGEEVKLQNRYSSKEVETILESNEAEKEITKEKSRAEKVVRKSLTRKKRGRPCKIK